MVKPENYIRTRDGVAITCGDSYACNRPAQWVNKRYVDETDPEQRFEFAMICNVHMAAMRRRAYGDRGTDYVALTADMPIVATLADKHAAQRKALAEQRENESRRVARAHAETAAREWEIADLDFAATFNPEAVDKFDYRRPAHFIIAPTTGQHVPGHFSDTTVEFSQTPGGPQQVRLASTGSYTPNEAFALAEAIIRAANMAESANRRARKAQKEA